MTANHNHSESPDPHYPDVGPTLGDIVEIIWLPALGAIATAATTWLIWYYSTAPCTPELAQIACCNPAPLARYINVEIFGRMLTYGAIVAGGLGFWRYDMIKRERAARIAAENRAIAIQQQADADRRQADADRRQADADREQERQRVAAEREQERQQVAADREQERQQFMSIINELVSQHRNGNHAGNDRGPTEQ